MFHELNLPRQALMSCRYYITTMCANIYLYLRKDDSGLDDGSNDFDQYLFDTELEAHEAAFRYYSRHKMYYPHNLALNVLRHGTQTGTVPKVETNESQVIEGSKVMEFI